MDKRIAPTIILTLVIILLLVQTGVIIYVLTRVGLGTIMTLVFLLVPLVIIAVLILVYIERMKEIRDEEKDDLSKY